MRPAHKAGRIFFAPPKPPFGLLAAKKAQMTQKTGKAETQVTESEFEPRMDTNGREFRIGGNGRLSNRKWVRIAPGPFLRMVDT
jgi:hypothetical protein